MSEKKFLVYIDQFKGAALPASWEVITAAYTLAAKLGGDVIGLVLGESSKAVAAQAYVFGLNQVFYCDDASLADYRPEPYAALLTKVAKEQDVEAVLLPTSTRGRELAAMSAVDLNTGVMPDITALDVVDGQVIVTRPVYSGKLLAKVVCQARPQIITTRVRAFKKPQGDSSRSGAPVFVAPVMAEGEIASKIAGYTQAEGGVSLTDASVIVSGGRGVSNNPALTPPGGLDEKQAEIWRAQQGFKLVGDLAAVLGAAVGASRAAVDAGYIPCGISGAIQHLAGMRSSKVIVAINKDSEAPIFKLARFGVVGDLYQILPPLAEAFHKRLGK